MNIKENSPIRIMIVDDHQMFIDGIRLVLKKTKSIILMHEACNGVEALEKLKLGDTDLVVTDISMPEMNGIELIQKIKAEYPKVKVLVLTMFNDLDTILDIVEVEAEGYILKNQPADSIIESLRAVDKGNIVLEREVANALSSMLKESKKVTPERLDISQRELGIFKLVGEGLSNKEIAERLNLSEGTTRNYVTGLLEKLGFRDRTQLAIFYIRNCE